MERKLPKLLFAGLLIAIVTLVSQNKAIAQTAAAGNGSTVTFTLNGNVVRGFGTGGFGALRPSSVVQFTGADFGNPAVFAKPSDYISWTNTKIVVKVPSGAGSGPVFILNNDNEFIGNITVPWNLSNITISDTSYIPRLINQNNAGGYTFHMSTAFNANTAANQSFMRAFNTWKCTSDINWTMGATTTTNVAADDGLNLVRFATPGDDVDAGILGETSEFFQSTDGLRWEVTDIDVTFSTAAVVNWSFGPGAPGASQYDFETVSLHELGHAHGLGHVTNTADVMNPFTSPGTTIRLPDGNNITAVNTMMAYSTAGAAHFVYPPMTALATTSCSVVNANLAGLTLSSGTLTPAFAQGTTSYTALVPTAATSVTVTPVASYAAATVKVNGITVPSGTASANIPLTIGPNTITTVVTGSDGATQQTYTVIVTRAGSPNDDLSNLRLSHVTLSPAFAAGVTGYTDTVANSIGSITVTPTTAVNVSTVKVNGVTVASGAASASIPLVVGPNIINTAVTTQDGTATKTYTVTVTREDSPANSITALRLSSGPISPAFVRTITSYTATVTNFTTPVTVTATAASTADVLTVNGIVVTSRIASKPITINAGVNTITVMVTTTNGSAKTYTITVYAGSLNDNLSNLKLSGVTLSPVFAAATTGYTGLVANSVTSTIVTPTTSVNVSTVMVNGVAVSSGTASGSIPLNVGPNNITTVVTAQNGSTTKTYTVTVTRAASSNANILHVKLSSGTLSPAFAQATTSYMASVANNVTSITVTPTTSDANATVKVNGALVLSGAASGPVTLNDGSNTVTVVGVAADGITTKTYTITVTRATGPLNSMYEPISVAVPENSPPLSDDVVVHQAVSPNGDGVNDFLVIDGISAYPENKLLIVNRNGDLVFELKGYDNNSKVFDGRSGKNGKMLQPGTYFYSLAYKINGVIKYKSGFIILKY